MYKISRVWFSFQRNDSLILTKVGQLFSYQQSSNVEVNKLLYNFTKFFCEADDHVVIKLIKGAVYLLNINLQRTNAVTSYSTHEVFYLFIYQVEIHKRHVYFILSNRRQFRKKLMKKK